MERLARFGVLRRSYGDAARHLVPLLAPCALVLVPLGLLATPVLVLAVNGQVIVVNQEPELTAVPAGALAAWAAVVLVTWLVLAVLVFPAVVIVAAGRLLGRRVPPVAALRAASLVVRADGRPLIAYRSTADGAVLLLDCRTPDCAAAGSRTLAPAGAEHAAPALVLDRSGRALVAYQDLEGRRLMLATCAGLDCVTTPVRNMRHGPGPALAMTLDARGRPAIVWTDAGGSTGAEVVVTVPLNLPWPHQTRSSRAAR